MLGRELWTGQWWGWEPEPNAQRRARVGGGQASSRGGTQASEQHLERRRARGPCGGHRGRGASAEGGREARTACWGLSKCETDKTHHWKTSSPKVIFTRKLCCMDLLLCAERILITTF